MTLDYEYICQKEHKIHRSLVVIDAIEDVLTRAWKMIFLCPECETKLSNNRVIPIKYNYDLQRSCKENIV